MIQINSAAVLEMVFSMIGNFAEGRSPEKKEVSGIEVAPFMDNADAAFNISADFEMSWGWRSRGRDDAESMGLKERRNVPVILALLEKYSIPITWATVGHLFLESCTRSATGLPHENMPRPLTDGRWSGDWYAHDPCSNVEKDPLWYAPDLIQQIIQSKVPHEIGTHTFSHANLRASYSTPELVCRELEACVEAMRPFGVRPKSLVFPRNREDYSYLPLLADAGIIAVRHREREGKVRLSYPERTSQGVYKIYESMNLRRGRYYDYVQKAKVFIEKAMERHAAYSLWFHPSDPVEYFETQLPAILQYVDSERKKGRLWVTTLADLAAYCEAREQLRMRPERVGNRLTLFLESSLDVSKYGAPEVTLVIPAPSRPKSAWLELSGGERKLMNTRLVSDISSQRLIVNVPTDARAVHVSF